MFSSLRHRLFIGFGLVILLTVILSGIVSAVTTANRFDILITEQGVQRAKEVAPLLEASYTFHGNWNGVINLLQSGSDEIVLDVPFDVEWWPDLDWFDLSADAVGLDFEQFFEELDNVDSMAQLAVNHNIDPTQLIADILAAEQEAVKTAVSSQELSAEEGQQYLANLVPEIELFIFDTFGQEYIESDEILFEDNFADADFVDWDEIIRQELSLSEEAYFQLLETQS
ncbi:hypothetical protein MNBD_CHLOROFLEXI01-5195, partial [hydrothermal vent metagenome]